MTDGGNGNGNDHADWADARVVPVPRVLGSQFDYLNGPVKQCEVDENENPKLDTCFDSTPFESVVLPPGL